MKILCCLLLLVVALLILSGCSSGQIRYESDVARLADSAAQQQAAIAKAATIGSSLVQLDAISVPAAKQIEPALTQYKGVLDEAHAALLVGDTATAQTKMDLYGVAASQIALLGAGDWKPLLDLATAGSDTVVAEARISPGEINMYVQMALAGYQVISQAIQAAQRKGLITNDAALQALATNSAAANKGLVRLRAEIARKE